MGLMPCVMCKTISQSANVSKAMKAIPTLDVMPDKVSEATQFSSNYFICSLHLFTYSTTFLVHPIEIYRPCNPSPCGANALCNEKNGAGSCTCMKHYFGDPYISCRPECIQNSDCDRSKSCVNTKCVDPCIGSCGLNAECKVLFHTPHCHCSIGYTGNANQICHKIETSKFQISHRKNLLPRI